MTRQERLLRRFLPIAAVTLAVGLQLACGAPDSNARLIVTSGFTDQVFVLDAATGVVLDSLSMDRRPGEPDEPHGVAVSPDGSHWYATLSHGESTLWKFEAPNNRLVGRLTLPTTGASRVRLSPDGALAAVPDYWRSGGRPVSQVAVVRTADLSVVGAPDVCEAPHDAVFSPTGDRIAVTCSQGDGVVILDASTLEVAARHALTADPGAGIRPMNAAWSHDGHTLFVSLMGRGVVATLDLTSGSWLETASGAGPAQIELSPDGAWLVVANRGDATATLLPVGSGEAVTISMPGAHPHGVAFDETSDRAYLTYEGDVSTPGGVVAVSLPRGEILWHVPLGVFTLGIAFMGPA